MDPDDDRQLWDVLGRAAAPKVSPFFARNVVRQLRMETQSGRRRAPHLWRILVPTTVAALLVVSGIIFLRNSPSQNGLIAAPQDPIAAASVSPEQSTTPPTVLDQQLKAHSDPSEEVLAQIEEKDYDVVQNLDDLMSTYETNLWDENSTL
jgi:hypothetical protein